MHATLFGYESWSVSACQGGGPLISSEHLTRSLESEMIGGNPCRGSMIKRSAVRRQHHGDFGGKQRLGVTESAAFCDC